MAALTLSHTAFLVAPSQSRSHVSLRRSVIKATSAVPRTRVAALRIVAMTTPDLKSELEQKIQEAEETCADPKSTAECAVAWDEVEEISAAASDLAQKAKEASDPLEKYCADNPEADECRVYSD